MGQVGARNSSSGRGMRGARIHDIQDMQTHMHVREQSTNARTTYTHLSDPPRRMTVMVSWSEFPGKLDRDISGSPA